MMSDYLLHGKPCMLGYSWTLKLGGEVIGEHIEAVPVLAQAWAEEILGELDEMEWITLDDSDDNPTFTGIVAD